MNKELDVLLIQPPMSNMKKASITIPLGIAYIASYLQNNEYNVDIIDMQVDVVPRCLLKQIIKKKAPKVIGLSTTILTYSNALRIASFIKKHFPKILITLGGSHSSFLETDLEKNRFIDFIIRGEGEETFKQLLDFYFKRKECKLTEIAGISYTENNILIRNKDRDFIHDLDLLPFPARGLFDLSKYDNPFSIITGRGCPFRCAFCTNSIMWKSTYRLRSITNIVDEIELITKDSNRRIVQILDDTFVSSEKRVLEFCEELTKRKLNIYFTCSA